jgi:hypothetical protein
MHEPGATVFTGQLGRQYCPLVTGGRHGCMFTSGFWHRPGGYLHAWRANVAIVDLIVALPLMGIAATIALPSWSKLVSIYYLDSSQSDSV